MKVFISWSDEPSRTIAGMIKEWLTHVIQVAQPFMSVDVDKGAKWDSEISKELEASDVGIIVLTANNLHKDWILFEAGALSKKFGRSRVCPLLCGLNPSDVVPPLSMLQLTVFNREDVLKMLDTINKATKSPVSDSVLKEAHELRWTKLEDDVKKALTKIPVGTVKTKRNPEEVMDEILSLSRSTAEAVHQMKTEQTDSAVASITSGNPIYTPVSPMMKAVQWADVVRSSVYYPSASSPPIPSDGLSIYHVPSQPENDKKKIT